MKNNKKVWIVDDDESIRWVLEKALKSSDVDIESFSRPEKVLEKIGEVTLVSPDGGALKKIYKVSCEKQ